MDFVGAIPRQFGNRLKETGITAEIGKILKTILLGFLQYRFTFL